MAVGVTPEALEGPEKAPVPEIVWTGEISPGPGPGERSRRTASGYKKIAGAETHSELGWVCRSRSQLEKVSDYAG